MTYSNSVDLIPKEVLFSNPLKTSPRISPDGKKMSYLAPVNDILNIWVGDIGENNYKPLTKDYTRNIRSYFWAEDNKHILYLQDVGGDENFRLFAVDIETEETRNLTPFDNVQVHIIEHNKHFPNELILGINKENPSVHDVYKLNLKTSELELLAKNPGTVISWVVTSDLKVLGSMTAKEDGGYNLLYRETENSEWKIIRSWDMEDSLNSSPVGFSKDSKYMYLKDSKDFNTSRLTKLELATGNVEVLAEDPNYDLSNVLIHPDTYEVQMISFYKAREDYIVLDESIKEDIENISKLNKGDFAILDRDTKDNTWLLAFTVDNNAVSFYAYDRISKEGKFLFSNKPELEKYTLSEMEPISFTSRDGLTVHGYISFPVGVDRKNLPMILDVHGGPWWRNEWGYNPEVQWMTNRGYVCLQVNFRGSTGYGKDFLNAGDKEWGAKMHDDLLDAVEWAVSQGYADRSKVAIYGGSYGGYAALVGATFTPDFFTCAVDIVGPSNLITLIQTIPAYWSTALKNFTNRVGNPETEEEFLKSRSPLFKVDNIKIPMFIAQGANDPRVKQSEADQIVEAMKSKGIEHEYFLLGDEGHGFVNPESKMKFYKQVEKFLAKQLGGRVEE